MHTNAFFVVSCTTNFATKSLNISAYWILKTVNCMEEMYNSELGRVIIYLNNITIFIFHTHSLPNFFSRKTFKVSFKAHINQQLTRILIWLPIKLQRMKLLHATRIRFFGLKITAVYRIIKLWLRIISFDSCITRDLSFDLRNMKRFFSLSCLVIQFTVFLHWRVINSPTYLQTRYSLLLTRNI